MRHIIAITLIGGLLAACGKSGADALIGTWVLDPEGLAEFDENFRNLPPAQKAQAKAMMEQMKFELTFTKDKVKMVMDMMGEKKTDEREYTVKSTDGNKIVLAAKTDGGKERTITVEVRGDRLYFSDGQKKLSFRRK